jgi:hypothetical protein
MSLNTSKETGASVNSEKNNNRTVYYGEADGMFVE